MSKTQLSIGSNVAAEIAGDILTIKIDLSKRLGPSKSGKTTVVATTQGNQMLPGGVVIGLNAYTRG